MQTLHATDTTNSAGALMETATSQTIFATSVKRLFAVLAACALGTLGALLAAGRIAGQDTTRQPTAAGVPKLGAGAKPALVVIAEPFTFHGSSYIKLSLENTSDRPCTVKDDVQPAWRAAKWFRVFVDGKEQPDRPWGSYSLTFGERKQIGAKAREFIGVVSLAGTDKARLLDGYSLRCKLAPGNYAIEIKSHNATPAAFKVTIPANLESAADNVARTEKPLRFTLAATAAEDATILTIHVANESTDLWHYPYRGDTPPWHRSNWYQLEIDGKIVKPYRNEFEHKDRSGRQEIGRMQQWYAHTLYLVTPKAKDRKFGNRYEPVYVLPEGEHVVRVIASPLWAKQKTPVPVPASLRIERVSASKPAGAPKD